MSKQIYYDVMKKMKFKDWNYLICAIIALAGVTLKVLHYNVGNIIVLSCLAWFFLVGSFVRVKSK
jgi:hypothetical protein